MELFINNWLKFFFLLTPFFALSMFLTLTKEHSITKKRRLAIQVTGAVILVCLIMYFFGGYVFKVFGITVDAFRVGAGGLLFLSAVSLVRTKSKTPPTKDQPKEDDIAVVPLATPIIVGPATIGTIIVFGNEVTSKTELFSGLISLLLAILSIGALLFVASDIERLLGKKGINILSKMVGLILSALAAQMILTGLKNFMG
jgi:multiple antibiotic resistance protein